MCDHLDTQQTGGTCGWSISISSAQRETLFRQQPAPSHVSNPFSVWFFFFYICQVRCLVPCSRLIPARHCPSHFLLGYLKSPIGAAPSSVIDTWPVCQLGQLGFNRHHQTHNSISYNRLLEKQTFVVQNPADATLAICLKSSQNNFVLHQKLLFRADSWLTHANIPPPQAQSFIYHPV